MDEDRAHALYKQLQQADYGARAKKGLGFSSNNGGDEDTEGQWQKSSNFVRGGQIEFCKAGKKRKSPERMQFVRESKGSFRARDRSRSRSRSRSPQKQRRRSPQNYGRSSDYQSYSRRDYSPRERSRNNSGHRDRQRSSERYQRDDRNERRRSHYDDDRKQRDKNTRAVDESKITPLQRLKEKTKEIIDSKTQAYIQQQAPNIAQKDLQLGVSDGVHVPETEQLLNENYQGQKLEGAFDHQKAIFGRYDGRLTESIQLSGQKKQDNNADMLNDNLFNKDQEDWRTKLMKLQREREAGQK
eukprot:TRINITY_DN3549_c0_g1_i2.p1 TRINITY_DN3549_c0_g1~~TRINITY_DN3549_c0_g1_i2.p1  ORF type:complete len:327 (-),score=33.60 TRINITY_DN3549_c0_g1_i2:358-1254(-)